MKFRLCGSTGVTLSILTMTALCVITGGKPVSAQTLTEQWSFKNFDGTGTFSTVPGVNTGTGVLKATGLSGTTAGWSFSSATINGNSTTVANFQNSYWLGWTPNFPTNGSATASFTNQYSVVMDVYFAPAPTVAPQDGTTSLLQTASGNNNDGDLFINASGGVGISGDYSDTGNATRFNFNAWNRLAFTVDTTGTTGANATNTIDTYINGTLQNIVQVPSGFGLDGRFSLDPTDFFFADDNGETNAGRISSLRAVNGVLTASQIAALGSPTAAGIGFQDAAAPEPTALLLAAFGALPLAGIAARRRAARGVEPA